MLQIAYFSSWKNVFILLPGYKLPPNFSGKNLS